MKIVETRTRRLILRPLKMSDYRRWVNTVTSCRPKQSRWDVGPKSIKECSRSRFRKLLRRHRWGERVDDSYWFAVIEKKSGRLVGAVDFDIYVRQTHQFANFGYFLYNNDWGKGYGQEASRAGLRIGFKQLRLNRLEAAINLDNKKSIRMVKAIGMKREGIKKRYWFEYGRWIDHLIYVANPEDIGMKAINPFRKRKIGREGKIRI